MGWTSPVIGVTAAFVLLGGCSDEGARAGGRDPSAPPSRSASAPVERPQVGGPSAPPVDPPRRSMDELERPIARRLGDEVARQGLVLEYLDCPIWHGKAPAQMRCEGYLNGVVATVVVRLTKTTNTVTFDAELQDGLLATRNLVRRLRAEGYRDIDCGATPAYPTVVGEELVCSVGDGSSAYVVAEVLDESGTVEIRDY